MTRAALFDLDGTLVDNMRYHVDAWVAFCARRGLKGGDAGRFERQFAGMKNEEILPLLLGRPISPDELHDLVVEKEGEYQRLYRPHLRLLPGAGELIARLRAAGVRTAIASAAPPSNRSFVLDGLGVRPQFDAVVGAEMVARGKPFPDVFLAAARAVGADPALCVVFEDAPNGVRAARAAGMFAVGVTTIVTEPYLREAGADAVVADFRGLPGSIEARLFGNPG